MFIEASAKTGYNIKRMFMRLASALPPTGSIHDVNHQAQNTLHDKNTCARVQLKTFPQEFEMNKSSRGKRHFCSC